MAARGVPPHVTVLFPFLPAGALTPDVHEALAELVARHQPFVTRFEEIERRGHLVWLLPADQQPFLRLTAEVVALWPDYPPYQGVHDELVAHLTLVESSDVEALDAGEAAAKRSGPFDAAATELMVIAEDRRGRWRTRWLIPFGSAPPAIHSVHD